MKNAPTQKQLAVVWCIVSAVLFALFFTVLNTSDRAIVSRTLTLGAMTSLIALPFGILLAWVANGRSSIAFAVRTFCVVGVLIPVFVHVSAWDAAFGKLGVITNTFGDVLKPVVSRWPAAIWIHAMIATPQVAILFWVAFRSGSEAWEDALRLEASPLGVRFRVLLWRHLPVAIGAVLWTMICCAREIGVTDIYQIGTLSEQVYLGYSLGQLNAIGTAWSAEQLAAAQNLGTAVVVLVVGWLAATAMYAFFSLDKSVARSESMRAAQLSRSSTLMKVVGVLLLSVVVVVPVANLIARVGFFVESRDDGPVASWSASAGVKAIYGVFANFQDEFYWSFLIAVMASSIVCILATPLVWFCRKSATGKIFLGLLFGALAAAPGPSIGLGVAKLFSQSDVGFVHFLYDRTIAAPVLANVLFCLPLAVPVFWFLASRVSVDQKEHATLEGIPGFRQFIQFSVLGHWKSNFGAWFLVAAFSFAELSATQMVLPPGMDTVPRLALGMLHAGVNESTAALTLVTLVPVILFAFLAQICFAENRRSRVE